MDEGGCYGEIEKVVKGKQKCQEECSTLKRTVAKLIHEEGVNKN